MQITLSNTGNTLPTTALPPIPFNSESADTPYTLESAQPFLQIDLRTIPPPNVLPSLPQLLPSIHPYARLNRRIIECIEELDTDAAFDPFYLPVNTMPNRIFCSVFQLFYYTYLLQDTRLFHTIPIIFKYGLKYSCNYITCVVYIY